MKAIAKHDCSVTLTTSLDSLSLNRMSVKRGDVIEFEVFKDEKITGKIAEVIGDRTVVFKKPNDFYLIPTYSKDFDYID